MNIQTIMGLMEDPSALTNMIGETIYKMIKSAATRAEQPVYITVKADVEQKLLNSSKTHSVAIQTHRQSDGQIIEIETPQTIIANIDDPQARQMLKFAGNIDEPIAKLTAKIKEAALKDGNFILIQKGKKRAVFSLLDKNNNILEQQKTFAEICQIIQTNY